MYDLTNVFDIFLPQLLSYPNPKDPLNPDAAALLIVAPDIYRIKTKQYVIKFAKGDPGILKEEKFLKNKKKLIGANQEIGLENLKKIAEEEEEKGSDFDENMSEISGASELSKTSNIDLIEDEY